MNPYSNAKIFHHIDRIVKIKQDEVPCPVHVNLVVSDVCNFNCCFCAYRMKDYPSNELFGKGTRLMPSERAEELLWEMKEAGVKAVQFTGGGEPTLHPDFPALLYCAQNLGMDTSVVTNGSRLSEDIRELLLECSWVRVSLDAGTAFTHAQMKGISEDVFQDVQKGIQSLSSRVHESGSDLYLGVGFVITRENWEEITTAARLVRSLGAHSIRFSAVYSSAGQDYYRGLLTGIRDNLERASEYQTKDFKVLDSFTERLADLKQGRPEYSRCLQQYVSTYVGADMNVYRCCVQAYNRKGLLGSIKDVRFDQFWSDPRVVDKLKGFDARSCPRCQFNGKNRIANAILDALPLTHVNFV